MILAWLWLAVGSAAPTNGVKYSNSTAIEGDTAVFRYRGEDGTLEYRWKRPGAAAGLLGELRLRATRAGSAAVELPWAPAPEAEWTETAHFLGSDWAADRDQATLTIRFGVGSGSAALKLAVRPNGKALLVDLDADRPVLRGLDVAGWDLNGALKVPVPYNPFDTIVFREQRLFASAYFDWTESQATSQAFPKLVYGARTDGTYNRLHDRLILTASWHMREVFAHSPNAPSRFLKEVAGRTVLDIWGGKFDDIAKKLGVLRDYGMGSCVALIHDWQHQGYDNGLPGHLPAAENLGGDEALRRAVTAAKDAGCYAALHENYVDYYPDYEKFDARELSRGSDGRPSNAWFNPGTKMQSWASRPSLLVDLASRQSPEIHRRYGTTAAFLDVNSSVWPWWRADMEAGQPGAGMFATFRDQSVKLWQYLSRTHGGPVFGEGNRHFFWSGDLDGVEAQLGAGIAAAGKGPDTELLVDFDLWQIHALQVNHGMGYYDRWSRAGLDPQRREVLDAYRMQEVAFGHAPFLGANAWSDVGTAWVEANLIGPVAKRYGTGRAAGIRYQVEGAWVDEDAAALAGAWKRVEVRYDNGDTIVANGAAGPLEWEGHTLPQYGWVARGRGLLAYTATKQGETVDYAETADGVFANARSGADGMGGGTAAAAVQVSQFRQTGPRAFAIEFTWRPERPQEADSTVFVHFVAASGGDWRGERNAPAFQRDHAPTVPTSRWVAGHPVEDGPYTVTLPQDLAEGEYRVGAGLYGANGRLALDGRDDGQRRYLAGMVTFRGGRITFQPETASEAGRAQATVDFGALKTDGSIRVMREGDGWALMPLNRARAFTVELSAQRFGRPEVVEAEGGTTGQTRPEADGDYWRLPLNGARQYRWRNGGAGK